jgi:putative tricarboxylic transport membrane protein
MNGDRSSYIIANLVWLGFSIAVAIESWHIDVGTLNAPGPGFLTFIAAALLGILSLISLVQCWKREVKKTTNIWIGGFPWRVGIALGALFSYVALLNISGFLLGSSILLFILFNVLAGIKWGKALIASILAVGAFYFLFVIILGSNLPKGFLGV